MVCGTELEFFVDLACQITNNASLIIGGIVAIVISGVFYWKQNKIQNTLNEISATYIIRTAVISLKVIFSGGDERTPSNEEAKIKYVELLRHNKTKFIKHNPDSEKLVNKIYDYAVTHKVDLSVNHEDFIKNVDELVSKYPNPFHIS